MTATPAGSNDVMEFILGILTPLLATGAISDIQLARRAATEMINAYNPRAADELVTIAQILGFALTALDNLRLSMTPGLSLPKTLKLRANANALNRQGLKSTQALDQARRPRSPAARRVPEQTPPPASRNPEPAARQPEPKPSEPPAATTQDNRLHWAAAMKKEAAILQTRRTGIPATQQKTNRLWASVLTNVANELTQTATKNPGMSKSELLRTTLLAGSRGFPAHLFAANKGKP